MMLLFDISFCLLGSLLHTCFCWHTSTYCSDIILSYLPVILDFFEQQKPEIHLFGAKFKERHKDMGGARAAYAFLRDELPQHYLLEVVLQNANMEWRAVY